MDKNNTELVKAVEKLNNSTPNGSVIDADTLLADILDEYDFHFTGIAQDILNIWKQSTDQKSVEMMFFEFTGVEFTEYLEKCKKEITKK